MFAPHTIESAPTAAQPVLKGAQSALGFVPNLYAVMAESPELLEAYTSISKIFDKTPLTPTERQVVLLATSFENGCDYCVAAHSAIAKMQGVAEDVILALREGTPLSTPKLEALRAYTTKVVQKRGWVDARDAEALVSAGFEKRTALDVVLGVSMKTMSNYANHVAGTPLDDAFQAQAWTRPESVARA